MSLDGQMEKLSALYGEKSDGELLALYEKREGLTDMAQQALAGVMRERGLAAPGAMAAEPLGVEGPSGETVGEDEGLIYMFHDAFEAREAKRHMREEGIAHRMLDWHEVEPEMERSPTGLDLGLVVRRVDAQRTVQVLKESLGLFPGPETARVGEADEFVVLSMFDREEALVAAGALGREGMTYLWRDGRDDTAGLPDEETVAIEVRAEDVDRATRVVESYADGES